MSSLRQIGDLSLALESVLIGCQVAVHGPDGVSFATQAMRLLMFCARYLDLYWFQIGWPMRLLAKAFLLLSTLTVVMLLGCEKYSQGAHRSISYGTIGQVVAVLSFSAALGANFMYIPTVVEFFWAFSRFIDVVVEVPQLEMIYATDKLNKWMIAYYCCIGSQVFFYALNLIYGTQYYGTFDIITPCTTIWKGVVIVAFLMARFLNQRWGQVQGKATLDSDASAHQQANEKSPIIIVASAV